MISPLMANAQQVEINELDLVGTWELVSYEGEFNYDKYVNSYNNSYFKDGFEFK